MNTKSNDFTDSAAPSEQDGSAVAWRYTSLDDVAKFPPSGWYSGKPEERHFADQGAWKIEYAYSNPSPSAGDTPSAVGWDEIVEAIDNAFQCGQDYQRHTRAMESKAAYEEYRILRNKFGGTP